MRTCPAHAAAAAPPPLPTPTRETPVEFHGTGSEYFKIWIANTALTLLTLGIYSAWAKVRSRRYFYGNTRIDGAGFEYLATPRQILLGRLLVGAVLIALGLAGQLSPVAYGILIGIITLATPWVIVKALRFNARYTAYRNVRFSFVGTTAEAYRLFLGLPLLCLVTLGIAVPYMEKRHRSWMFSSYRWGNQQAADDLSAGEVYGVYFRAAGVSIALFVPLVGVIIALGASETRETDVASRGALFILLGLLAAVFLSVFVRVRVTNLLFANGRVGRLVGFRSTLAAGELFFRLVGYFLLTVLTLGLAYPWTRVELAKYRARTLLLFLWSPLAEVVEEASTGGSAVADQVAEGRDLDIDLGS
jgi:uncharacterized membrane protein YjgN (DUF898 family)